MSFQPIYVTDPYFTPDSGGGFSLFGSLPTSTANPAPVHNTPLFDSLPTSTANPAPVHNTPLFDSGGGGLLSGIGNFGKTAVGILGDTAIGALQGGQALLGAQLANAISQRTDADERQRFSTATGTGSPITAADILKSSGGAVLAVVGVAAALFAGFALLRD